VSKIKLDKDVRQYMLDQIKNYFYMERNEEIGELASSLMLDFIIDKLGPGFYNQGVMDAYAYINEKSEDMLGLQK
jgi:uncharacterized protein (DUF2164 family)